MIQIQAVIISAALLTSPVLFAQDVSCDSNMNELATDSSSPLETLSADTRTQIEEHIRLAVEAQAAGNQQQCIVHSSMALDEIRKTTATEDLNTDIIEQ